MSTHLKKQLENKVLVAYLYRGHTVDGGQGYAYVVSTMEQFEALAEAKKKQQPVNFRDYGQVLASGFGDPTPDVMAEMEEKYGIRHEDAFHV